MLVLQEEFEEYAEKAKTLPDTTSNENKLILYGLFKQATVGPVNTGMYANDDHTCLPLEYYKFSCLHKQ